MLTLRLSLCFDNCCFTNYKYPVRKSGYHFQFDLSRINTHSSKLMPERLPEFNRYALKRKLQNEEESKELIEQVKLMIKNTYPERYASSKI